MAANERWVFTGRCWKFGHDVPNDGGLMDKVYMSQLMEYDPAVLAKHVLENVRQEFPREVRAGDIVVAGKRFAHGNPHIQGCLGLKGAGVALIAESVQRSAYRVLISAGVPFIPKAAGILAMADDGDPLTVDVASGHVTNERTGQRATFEPLPAFLLDIIAAGGSLAHLKQRLITAGRIPSPY
jgi:3-isopropylmalate/(R)-2-methylmalate dehydratase small subunit